MLSKLDRSVGTRAESVQAPVRHEVPPDVVREAIVNAIAHRDYSSSAAVQVSVFADRVEVWNPGQLLSPLTPERLRHPHSSIARNHRICEVLFLARYIEKFGTGTLMMIRESLAHALPEPDFVQQAGELVTTVWRDWLTDKAVNALGLNERQRQAIAHLKTSGSITSREYQTLTGAPPRTTTRDLDELVNKRLLRKVGTVGRGARYVACGKPANNQPNRPPVAAIKSAINRPNRPSAQTRRKSAKPGTAKPASPRPAPNKPGQAAKPDARKGKAK